MKSEYGERCPYCQSDLSKSYQWVLDNCPVLLKDQFIKHLKEKHMLNKVSARELFNYRFKAWKEKI